MYFYGPYLLEVKPLQDKRFSKVWLLYKSCEESMEGRHLEAEFDVKCAIHSGEGDHFESQQVMQISAEYDGNHHTDEYIQLQQRLGKVS